jgi:hypothetical protein
MDKCEFLEAASAGSRPAASITTLQVTTKPVMTVSSRDCL